MKLQAFAAYDSAVEAFMPPFFARSKGEAMRSFSDACSDNGRFAPHLGHYSLFHLGEFDDTNGLIVPVTPPYQLLTGLEAVTDYDRSAVTGNGR